MPTAPDEWRPAVGEFVCTCGYEHLRVVELNPEDDDLEVVVEGGGSYSLRHCGWPEPIASLYREAHDAALNGVYANTKSLCRQALRAVLASPEATDSRLTDLIIESVAQGKLPVGIQEWATEIDLISSEGIRHEDHPPIRDYDASDALLFTRSCLQALHGASARS